MHDQRSEIFDTLPLLNRPTVQLVDEGSLSGQFSAIFAPGAVASAIVTGDARLVLRRVLPATFQSCMTSPPYWGLRDYNIDGQIGLETSVDSYIHSLVDVFEEVRRVLRDDGTLWLNVGDSFTSGGRTWRAPDKKNPVRAMSVRPPTPPGLKSKDLIGVPWKLAFALQSAGWYLRTEIIWNKPNCQPESVKDRPTRSHEYVFLFSKSERYVYEGRSVRGPNDRNLRTVWDINTYPVKDAHFATFPPALVQRCIELGTGEGDFVLDPFIGSGTTGIVAHDCGRRFFGIELNREYVQIAEKRLNGRIKRIPADAQTAGRDPTTGISPTAGGRSNYLVR
jgi:site-specific DNA-methyltransferase (cytosine-N4-specific)